MRLLQPPFLGILHVDAGGGAEPTVLAASIRPPADIDSSVSLPHSQVFPWWP